MKKSELMKYLSKTVTITFTDGTIYCGTLEYTTEKKQLTRNWFILGDMCFKAKHVKEFMEGEPL